MVAFCRHKEHLTHIFPALTSAYSCGQMRTMSGRRAAVAAAAVTASLCACRVDQKNVCQDFPSRANTTPSTYVAQRGSRV